jgi:hypothetical protein
MKKRPLLLISLISWTLLFGAISNMARADITSWRWLGYAYNAYDSFHRATVYAYEEGSTAVLSVTVYNDYVTDKPVNISALKVGLDWGKNYTSSMASSDAPYVIPWHETRIIPIAFTVPNLTEVSNQAQYSYTIYLEHVNATIGPKKITSLKEFEGTNFVVYSSDQVNAQGTKQIVEEMLDTMSPRDFNSTKARIMWTKSENETFVAGLLYAQGDFAGAETHYGTALSWINQAFTAEQDKGGGFDDAQVAVLEAQAKSLEATANYMNGLSNMWVLIGVAAVLFAIGYIIRGLGAFRKPVVAST